MSTNRYYAIDHLRIAMMFVVMLGHPLLPYITVPRIFKDPSTHIGFDYIAVFLYAFAMQAFFVTAGFATALVLERKGMQGLWKNRFLRIFIPLLVAYLCISPLMRGAYQFSAAVVEFNSIDAGWNVFMQAEWLRWSKVYHLWFLVSLLVFTALSCLVLSVLKTVNQTSTTTQKVAHWFQAKYGSLLIIAIVSITTIPSYVLDTGRGTHWSMQITLWIYFLLGWFFYHHQKIIEVYKHAWLKYFVTALLVLPICIWATRERLFDEHNIDILTGIAAGMGNGILGVCMTLALLGLFYSKFNEYSRIGNELGKSSYWVYLIHYPIVVAVGGVVSIMDTQAIFKYLLTIAISIPIIAITYLLFVLKTPLRTIIVGKN